MVGADLFYYARASSSGARISKAEGEGERRWREGEKKERESKWKRVATIDPPFFLSLPLSNFSPPLLTSFLGFRATSAL